MDEYLRANQKLWNEWTGEHENSPFYDVEGFKAGKERLKSIELAEVGDVRGKSLLHLQCHFGPGHISLGGMVQLSQAWIYRLNPSLSHKR